MAVPMLPPTCTSRPAALRMCAVSAVVVDLPLVPVMAMNGTSKLCVRALAREQLEVADDLDARELRLLDGPVRLGMRQRHAGCQHERRERRPVRPPSGPRSECLRRPQPPRSRRYRRSPPTSAPPAIKRARRRHARAAEAEHRDPLAGERGDANHGQIYRGSPDPGASSAASGWQGRPAPAPPR